MNLFKVKYIISLPIAAVICIANTAPASAAEQGANSWNTNTNSAPIAEVAPVKPPKYYVEPTPQMPTALTQGATSAPADTRFAPANLEQLLSTGRPTTPVAIAPQQQPQFRNNTQANGMQIAPGLQNSYASNGAPQFGQPQVGYPNTQYAQPNGFGGYPGGYNQGGFNPFGSNNGFSNGFPGGFGSFPTFGGFPGGNMPNSNFSPFGFW